MDVRLSPPKLQLPKAGDIVEFTRQIEGNSYYLIMSESLDDDKLVLVSLNSGIIPNGHNARMTPEEWVKHWGSFKSGGINIYSRDEYDLVITRKEVN